MMVVEILDDSGKRTLNNRGLISHVSSRLCICQCSVIGSMCGCKALLFVPDIGRAVNIGRSRRGLCSNGDVHHFIMGDPPLLFHAGVFDQCDHGASAAEGERSGLRKGQEEIR